MAYQLQFGDLGQYTGMFVSGAAVTLALTAVSTVLGLTVGVLGAAVGTPVLKLTHSGSWTALGQPREAFLPAARIIRSQRPGDWPQAFQLAQAALDALLLAR